MADSSDTIVAPVTARGQAGVAIVRLSGPRAGELLCAVAARGAAAVHSPRTAVLTAILDGDSKLDEGLCLFFPGPQSYTGEDVAELQVHGSPFVVRRLLERLIALGARQARAGEFTERAYLNGRMDLSQAEAVADLIAAETAVQARVAREQLGGRLSKAVSDLGEPLRNLLAEIEAHIDFPEEGISPLTYDEWAGAAARSLEVVDGYLSTYASGRIFREGALVVLAGLPNAGKSSLLNRLLGEDRAIVTAIPGTTRDSIEEAAEVDGLCVRFCDTAGLLDAEAPRILDPVEQLGVERSWKRLENADLVLFVFDAGEGLGRVERIVASVRERNSRVLLVATKQDLLADDGTQRDSADLSGEAVLVSSVTGEGIDRLRAAIVTALTNEQHRSGSLMVTNQRHYDALRDARAALAETLAELRARRPAELISINIRSALGALEEIVGVTPTEDILGRIFSKFCIGK